MHAPPDHLSRRGYTHQGWLTEDHVLPVDDELDELNGRGSRPATTYVWDTANLHATRYWVGAFWNGPTAATDHNQFIKGKFSYQATYKAGLLTRP